MKKRILVLVSGGLDSVTALYHSAEKHHVVAGVSFNYGSKHNHKELPEAAWHCAQLGVAHQVIQLGFMESLFKSDLLNSGGAIPEGHYEEESMRATVVPFRNGIMLAIAAGLAESCGAEGLVIAAHFGDHAIYPDCREEFMQAIGQAIQLGTYEKIDLMRPFIAMTKAQIALRGHELGVDFAHTWSCYKGGDIHCGACGTCIERREAFLLAGLKDPATYAVEGPLPSKPSRC